MTDSNPEEVIPQEPILNSDTSSAPLSYEETPVITPIPETPSEKQPTVESPTSTISAPKKLKTHPIFNKLKIVLLFVVLFIVGFTLSGVVRNFINQQSVQKQTTNTSPTPTINQIVQTTTPTPTSVSTVATVAGIPHLTPTITPSITGWTVYAVLNGKTRTAIPGLTVQLPNTVLIPVCDGTSCGSQGTYLPGGTRFTIAVRGEGQVLADFRGKTITDANGKALTTTTTTIAGKQATEYTTDTNGSTNGGYGFTSMHGYMIVLSDTLSLEINHFSPAGITTDFTADETIFSSILKTLTFPTNLVASTTLTPTSVILATATPTPTTTTVTPIH